MALVADKKGLVLARVSSPHDHCRYSNNASLPPSLETLQQDTKGLVFAVVWETQFIHSIQRATERTKKS
jgi:hypothetical protein